MVSKEERKEVSEGGGNVASKVSRKEGRRKRGEGEKERAVKVIKHVEEPTLEWRKGGRGT